ncbi:CoA-binding protein [Paenibacillus sp. 598K]|uniref:CoA-binding protein n=1 Tax=Paenibacillus sp. 598K TaxID=1117987 RepID=UPI000FFE9878|nr:CoA-binding protein [Paenibacillus sp. 598K]
MSYTHPSRDEIRTMLGEARTVAVVGLSDKPERTSYMVSEAMQQKGYRIIPVNPAASGPILGETCYASLEEIPEPIDIVNVFRRSEHCPEIAAAAVRIGASVLWLQLGVYSEEAAEIAASGGLQVVMDRCIKVEDSLLWPQGKSSSELG